jgi:hypothetical protein
MIQISQRFQSINLTKQNAYNKHFVFSLFGLSKIFFYFCNSLKRGTPPPPSEKLIFQLYAKTIKAMFSFFGKILLFYFWRIKNELS